MWNFEDYYAADFKAGEKTRWNKKRESQIPSDYGLYVDSSKKEKGHILFPSKLSQHRKNQYCCMF